MQLFQFSVPQSNDKKLKVKDLHIFIFLNKKVAKIFFIRKRLIFFYAICYTVSDTKFKVIPIPYKYRYLCPTSDYPAHLLYNTSSLIMNDHFKIQYLSPKFEKTNVKKNAILSFNKKTDSNNRTSCETNAVSHIIETNTIR